MDDICACATANVGDDVLLAGVGLKADTIDQETNPELLWLTVRLFVLTNRVSIGTQQTILRRLWKVDRILAESDALDVNSSTGADVVFDLPA